MIGIYKITNLLTGKIYIGQSKNLEKRFKEHANHNNSEIDYYIHKYGIDNFKFEILEECSIDELDIKEDFYIIKYQNHILKKYGTVVYIIQFIWMCIQMKIKIGKDGNQ